MQKAMDSIAGTGSWRQNDDEVEIWFYNLDRRNSEGSYGFAYNPGSDPDEGWSPPIGLPIKTRMAASKTRLRQVVFTA